MAFVIFMRILESMNDFLLDIRVYLIILSLLERFFSEVDTLMLQSNVIIKPYT